MTLEQLVADYGSVGLFLGAGLEGEAVAMLGGILVHRHLIGFGSAVVALALGAFLADQAFFLLGRWARTSARVRAIQRSGAGARVLKTFNAHPVVFVLSFRFLYGLRIASAVIIGTAGFPWPRFMALNAIAALFWALVWVTLGYACGQASEGVFGWLDNVPHLALLGGAIALGITLLAVVALKRRRGRRANTGD